MKEKINLIKFPLLFLMVMLFSTSLAAQVQGKVTDEGGEALLGATIQVKGTASNGTVTDFDGNFSIDANSGDVLLISYIGYSTQELVLTNETNYNVILTEGVELNQVVVTGYTAQNKRDITGAVSTLEAKDLLAVPTTNVGEAIQGRVAGVTVGQEGGPGGGTMVRIRGF